MAINGLYEEVLIAGFGGQGIILAGRLLAQTAMKAGKEVTCMPSYGAEVRGGTANCMVVISDRPIACPLVSRPDSLIAMSKASANKFAKSIKDSGVLVMNSSLIKEKPELPESIEILSVPADELALELGNIRAANMVALGAYLQKSKILSVDTAVECLPEALAKRHHQILSVNAEALRRGAQFVAGNNLPEGPG
jgi:2-oxoglutarate ferredoxin oxidoreductase subunit gamma